MDRNVYEMLPQSKTKKEGKECPDDLVNNYQIGKITYLKTHDPYNRPWRIGKTRTWGHNGCTVAIIDPLRIRDVALEDETI